eukprot:m.127592 g.127592  ORF g.127592 m.127592 type:complete len:212 (+) comp14551_c0_seq7:154-789(+)
MAQNRRKGSTVSNFFCFCGCGGLMKDETTTRGFMKACNEAEKLRWINMLIPVEDTERIRKHSLPGNPFLICRDHFQDASLVLEGIWLQLKAGFKRNPVPLRKGTKELLLLSGKKRKTDCPEKQEEQVNKSEPGDLSNVENLKNVFERAKNVAYPLIPYTALNYWFYAHLFFLVFVKIHTIIIIIISPAICQGALYGDGKCHKLACERKKRS